MVLRLLKQAGQALIAPEKMFRNTQQRTIESMVNDYLKLVLTMGIITAILAALWSLGRSAYYDLFLHIDVHYLRLLNYLVGKTFSIAFGYLIAGTFGLFFISIVLNTFLRMKYVQLLKILFIAVTPLLLLIWIPDAIVGTALWSAVLLVIGIKETSKLHAVKKTSIQQRD
ncbi:hypothetical protein GF367_04960 [Candidatus Woesearchaeota archaeon]|nr:hypothetical protein [Candidatus Woesearchaeota archaeon]